MREFGQEPCCELCGIESWQRAVFAKLQASTNMGAWLRCDSCGLTFHRRHAEAGMKPLKQYFVVTDEGVPVFACDDISIAIEYSNTLLRQASTHPGIRMSVAILAVKGRTSSVRTSDIESA